MSIDEKLNLIIEMLLPLQSNFNYAQFKAQIRAAEEWDRYSDQEDYWDTASTEGEE